MAEAVVDASTLAAILFNEPDGPRLAQSLSGVTLLAPSIAPYEVASVCLRKMRHMPESREALVLAYGRLSLMGVRLMDVAHADVVLLAERAGLSTYDASYLWLSHDAGAPLVTLDKALERAAKRMGAGA